MLTGTFLLSVVGALCVWRITHFLYAEDGPWDCVILLRQWAGEGFIGKTMDCFYCLSFWIALPIAFLCGETWLEKLLLIPALSAVAILLERVTGNLLDAYPHEIEYHDTPPEQVDSDTISTNEQGG